jgi:hypothetical protein
MLSDACSTPSPRRPSAPPPSLRRGPYAATDGSLHVESRVAAPSPPACRHCHRYRSLARWCDRLRRRRRLAHRYMRRLRSTDGRAYSSTTPLRVDFHGRRSLQRRRPLFPGYRWRASTICRNLPCSRESRSCAACRGRAGHAVGRVPGAGPAGRDSWAPATCSRRCEARQTPR